MVPAMPSHPPPPAPAAPAWLALKLPPLVLVALTAGAMWALPALARLPLPPAWRTALGVACAAAGLAVCLAGVLAFRQARTTVDPVHPGAASALVVRGIYRRTRNPMYLGFALALLGWALALGTLAALAPLPIFVAWLNRWQIAPEEAALRARFGADFDAYAARVPRWLPRPGGGA